MNRLHYLDLNEPPMDAADKIVCWGCLVAIVVCIFLLATNTAQAEPIAVMLQPSDRIVNPSPYSSTIQPIDEVDPVRSVQKQCAASSGNVILWIGARSLYSVERLHIMLDEAHKCPQITHVYVYDEIGWTHEGLNMKLHRAEIYQGVRMVRAAGYKVLVTILPDVILRSDFDWDVSQFDAISVDVYPGIRSTQPDLHGCFYTPINNYLANLAYCSAQKLKGLGFTGQLGYIYQAFGIYGVPESQLKADLILQREAIDYAEAMGFDAVLPFGMYLGAAEQAKEPIYPLGNTKFRRLIQP
jgi:hypothetical protein